MCMPFRRPRVWAGGKPAISMRACTGVVHAFGSRRLGYRGDHLCPAAGAPGDWAGWLPEGFAAGQLAVHHGPQDHRPPVPDHIVRLFLVAGLMAMIMRAQL